MLKTTKKFFLFSVLILLVQVLIACERPVVAHSYSFVAKDNWQYASKAAPTGLMQQVVKENIRSGWLGDAGRMQILKIQESDQQKPLYLIDSKIQHKCPARGCDPLMNPLCGSAGCAYLGYIQDGKSYRQVFKEYLKTLLPPGVPFLRVSKQFSSGFPCLEFAELTNVMDANSLQTTRYCYKKNKYIEQI